MRDIYGIKITLSNYCGYNCKYCFVNIDDKKIIEALFFQRLVDYYIFQKGDIKRFSFLGGEVLLFFDVFQKCLDYILEKNIDHRIYLVTSGLGITRERVKILAKYNVLIGVSIDGPEYIHSKNRVDKKGQSSYQATRDAISLLNEYYSDKNLGYTITVDEDTVYDLFQSFLYLSQFDTPRRNVGIAATYTTVWKKENMKKLAQELKKICSYIYQNILEEEYYYYNILGFFILQLLDGKEPKDGNLEIHAFPDGHISEMLFAESRWENKTLDPNFVRFGIVIPYAKKIIETSLGDVRYERYIKSLYHKAIF